MPKPFAKLYGPDDDQVLVLLGESEEGSPEIRVYFDPGPPFNVSSVALGYTGCTEEFARERFDEIDEAAARRIAQSFIKFISDDASDDGN